MTILLEKFKRIKYVIEHSESEGKMSGEFVWAMVWVFYGNKIDPDGFYASASRLNINPEEYRRDLLENHKLVRDFLHIQETPAKKRRCQ